MIVNSYIKKNCIKSNSRNRLQYLCFFLSKILEGSKVDISCKNIDCKKVYYTNQKLNCFQPLKAKKN